ncbi:MinD/ParA family protein [Microbacterium paludicola]|uniref:MinD/ParA family ATP-binding protein n=1 Tax=Microbacterium paludicola TaxID=300019 RepID=UPI0021B6CAA5|nr:MinD/ParA family protein [Microbacterium paludicola]
MTSKNNRDDAEGDDLGVLDESASLDTTSLGVLGQTAQVAVVMPGRDEDDDLSEDAVVDGEIPAASFEILLESGKNLVVEPSQSDAEEPEDVAHVEEPEDADGTEQQDAAEDDSAAVDADVADDAEPIVESAPVVPAAPAAKAEPAKAEPAKPAAKAEPAANAEPAKPAAKAEPVAKTEAAVPAQAIAKKPAAPAAEQTASAASAPAASASTPDRPAELTLASKRLDDQRGQSSRETADLLTADRLLTPSPLTKPEPEGTWSHLLYTVSGRRINIGDGRKARERKALTARIASPLGGSARFVPILSRKGGVGKTTITALLGMALADAREDRVIAVDANPDRGTLADRIVRSQSGKSVRDLVRIHDEVKGYHDISAIVARDSTRLDVLASDTDPRIADAFSDEDYRNVADVAAHYYSLVLTDTGTGIVHSVMDATLDLADQIVIVSGLSVDEARLASETLTWLEANGHEDKVRNAVIVLNQSTPGSPLVRLNELEAHFKTRAKNVVRMPYDPQIAGGGAIVFANLQPETRTAARELAALLIEGLRARVA